MRGRSHRSLGEYLVREYMSSTPKRYTSAFLFGCVEPDRNPATYLKGSIRAQWLRGHNWGNTQRFMHRLSKRLEKRAQWSLWDYYSMGKLIHYITDSFTSAHNTYFDSALTAHRSYEVQLQDYFLCFLSQEICQPKPDSRPVMDTVRDYHHKYSRKPINIHTDSRYAILVCSIVAARLLPKL